jgi:uncharacterized repeat protein (TIGR01451 family)
MKKLIRSLIPSLIIFAVLSACIFTTTPTPETSLLAAQPTATLNNLVKLELTVQTDTSAPYNTLGQNIKFSYSIKALKNDSSEAAANVNVIGATATCPPLNTIGNLNDRLDQDETIVCIYNYPITQADLDKGSLVNIATATAYGVLSNTVTTTVGAAPAKALSLTKSVDPATYERIGQTITYNYVIKNSGTTSLGPAQFTVSDTGISTPINCGEATVSLASNATVTCSSAYTVVQADMAAASISTSATASGGGAGPSQPASATITKSAPQSNPNLIAGSTIKHQVANGEWLWQIARCYGADPNKVSAANPPKPGEISPSTTVIVPNIGSDGKIYGPPCVGTHTVQTGDTWETIALIYNADLEVLKMVNANTLTVGDELKVPLNSAQ